MEDFLARLSFIIYLGCHYSRYTVVQSKAWPYLQSMATPVACDCNFPCAESVAFVIKWHVP